MTEEQISKQKLEKNEKESPKKQNIKFDDKPKLFLEPKKKIKTEIRKNKSDDEDLEDFHPDVIEDDVSISDDGELTSEHSDNSDNFDLEDYLNYKKNHPNSCSDDEEEEDIDSEEEIEKNNEKDESKKKSPTKLK